jgi:hypothetical protein
MAPLMLLVLGASGAPGFFNGLNPTVSCLLCKTQKIMLWSTKFMFGAAKMKQKNVIVPMTKY